MAQISKISKIPQKTENFQKINTFEKYSKFLGFFKIFTFLRHFGVAALRQRTRLKLRYARSGRFGALRALSQRVSLPRAGAYFSSLESRMNI